MEDQNDLKLSEIVWTYAEIERGLRQLPALKAFQTDKVIQARKTWDELRLTNKIERAKSMIQNRLTPEGKQTPAKMLEALADSECVDFEVACIGAESDYRIADAELSKLDDLYTSCRKAANLILIEFEGKSDSITKRRP